MLRRSGNAGGRHRLGAGPRLQRPSQCHLRQARHPGLRGLVQQPGGRQKRLLRALRRQQQRCQPIPLRRRGAEVQVCGAGAFLFCLGAASAGLSRCSCLYPNLQLTLAVPAAFCLPQGSTTPAVAPLCSSLPAAQRGAPDGACYATINGSALAYKGEPWATAGQATCSLPDPAQCDCLPGSGGTRIARSGVPLPYFSQVIAPTGRPLLCRLVHPGCGRPACGMATDGRTASCCHERCCSRARPRATQGAPCQPAPSSPSPASASSAAVWRKRWAPR